MTLNIFLILIITALLYVVIEELIKHQLKQREKKIKAQEEMPILINKKNVLLKELEELQSLIDHIGTSEQRFIKHQEDISRSYYLYGHRKRKF